MNSKFLTDKVALVTGASRGLGKAIALALAAEGASIAAVARSEDALKETLEAIRATGGVAEPYALDVSDEAAVEATIEKIVARFQHIDILINNAGVAITRDIQDLSEIDFDQTIAVNLKSVFLCTQAVLPLMRSKGWGRIVNISSGAARGAGAIGPHYNASKAGMEGLTRGYAARLVKEGITVNAVAPSLIETDMMKGQHNLVSRIPVGRFGKAEEVATAVMMLLDNAYMTGQTIALSGGMAFN